MTVDLVGANPGLTLFDDTGGRTAFVSVWRVDLSRHGRGHAVVLWYDGAVRIVSEQPMLAAWLAHDFVRHFPEADGLAWTAPAVEVAPVDWTLDLAHGFTARAGDVTVEITDPLDHRLISADTVDLGGVPRGFSTVFVPCGTGSLRIGDALVPGHPRVDPSARTSTAFLADAEVWTDGP